MYLVSNLTLSYLLSAGKMLEECLRAGERLWPNPPQFLNTIAEAIKLQPPGFNTFNILKELAEKDVFEMVRFIATKY